MPPNNDYVFLNDGETFTSLEGCELVVSMVKGKPKRYDLLRLIDRLSDKDFDACYIGKATDKQQYEMENNT